MEEETIAGRIEDLSAPTEQEPTSFAYELGDTVTLLSGERGYIIGRAEFAEGIDSYLVRYTAADGRLSESWWNEPASYDVAKDEETVPAAT